MKSSNRKKWIAGVLAALWLLFIWGNSLLTGEESGAVSDLAGGLLAKIFGPWMEQATTLIRKTAHFLEFGILGLLLGWNERLRREKSTWLPVFLGLLAAMTDETIQRFTPERASQVTDVWIDLAGVVFGWCLLQLLFRWKRYRAGRLAKTRREKT